MPHAWVSLNGKVVDLTCLKTCNPYRSHQLDVTERGGPRTTKSVTGTRIAGGLGIFGEFLSHALFVGAEFVDHGAAEVSNAPLASTARALRSKSYSEDPMCQRSCPW